MVPIPSPPHRSFVCRGAALATTVCCLAFLLWLLLVPAVPVQALPEGAPEASSPRAIRDATQSHGSAETPYWIWVVLPRLFPDYLPAAGGYLSLGFAWPEGEEVPLGIAKRPRTALSPSFQQLDCLACHRAGGGPVAEATTTADGARLIRQAMFSHGAYEQFLRRCAEDPRFTAGYLLPAIRYNVPVKGLTALRYRYQWIPQARRTLLQLDGQT